MTTFNNFFKVVYLVVLINFLNGGSINGNDAKSETSWNKIAKKTSSANKTTSIHHNIVTTTAIHDEHKKKAAAHPHNHKELWCWVGPHLYSAYSLANVPAKYCTHVVRCCVVIDESGSDIAFTDTTSQNHLAELKKYKFKHAHVRTLIGVGGPEMRVSALKPAATNGNVRFKLIQNLERMCHDYRTDGIVLYITNTLESFDKIMRETDLIFISIDTHFRANGLTASTVLPADSAFLLKHFSFRKYIEQERGPIIKIMHNVASHVANICPDPYHIEPMKQSASQVSIIDSLQSYYENDWVTMIKNTLFTVSFRGSAFTFNNKTSGREMNYQKSQMRFDGHRCYWKLCEKVNKDQWTSYHSQQTDCFVVYKNNEWWSSVGLQTSKLLTLYPNLRGAVIFFPECDDVKGVCGEPYSLTKHFADVLGIEACNDC